MRFYPDLFKFLSAMGFFMKKNGNIFTVCILIMAVFLSACSFRLRGLDQTSVTTKYSSIYLRGDTESLLYQELYARLNTLGLPMVDESGEGTVIIAFSNPKIRKSLVSVDSHSQDVEYSLSSKTVYYFIDGGIPEKDQSPARRLSGHTRNYLNKNDEVLGSANEAEIIEQDLIKQTAEDIYIQFLRL